MNIFYRAVTIAAAFVSGTAALQAGSWTRAEAGKYELLTDAGTRDAQRMLLTAVQTSQAFTRILGELPPRTPPVRILAFRQESDFRKFRRNAITRGFFQGSAERDYIALTLAASQRDRILKHELAHLFLVHKTGPLPQWLEEGTAEFLSTLETVKEKAIIGGAIESHVALLASERWLPFSRFLSVTKNDPEFNHQDHAGSFYAQSWALVHMLHHHPAYQGRMAALTASIAEGLSSQEALARIYGPLDRVEADLRRYMAVGRFALRELTIEAPAPTVPITAVLAERNVLTAFAELHAATGNLDEARETYARLVEMAPDNTQDRWTAGGFLALREGRTEDAINYFRRSVEGGTRNASVDFELAMLLRDARRPDGEVKPLLHSATEKNPAFAEAWYQLGLLQLREKDTEGAIDSFRNAARILPRQAPFWNGLARAYQIAGAREAAKEAAWRAAEAAESEEQRMTALGLMRELKAAPGPAGRPQPEVHTPPSWERRRGDSSAEGTLIQVDCRGESLVLLVQSAGRTLRLVASSPRNIEVDGGTASREFPCGQGLKMPVVVEFVGSSMELIAIRYQAGK